MYSTVGAKCLTARFWPSRAQVRKLRQIEICTQHKRPAIPGDLKARWHEARLPMLTHTAVHTHCQQTMCARLLIPVIRLLPRFETALPHFKEYTILMCECWRQVHAMPLRNHSHSQTDWSAESLRGPLRCHRLVKARLFKIAGPRSRPSSSFRFRRPVLRGRRCRMSGHHSSRS